jgi:hypothetical protein
VLKLNAAFSLIAIMHSGCIMNGGFLLRIVLFMATIMWASIATCAAMRWLWGNRKIYPSDIMVLWLSIPLISLDMAVSFVFLYLILGRQGSP